MVRPRASLWYVPRGALTCSTRREPNGKVRLARGRKRVSRQGEGEPGLSVLVVSQNAEDSGRANSVGSTRSRFKFKLAGAPESKSRGPFLIFKLG